jgi:hypothetical protein
VGTASELRRAGVSRAFELLTGEDFDIAAPTARARAKAELWGPDAGHESRDFVALVLDTVLVGKDAAEQGQKPASALLDRTLEILARKSGYDSRRPTPPPANPTETNALAIVAIVVGAATTAAVVAYLIYRASQVVTAELAIHAASRELMRAHADALNVLEAHRKREAIAGTAIPFDVGELAILQRLQDAQDTAARVEGGAISAAAAPPVGISEGLVLGLAVAGGLVYFLWGRK